MHVKCMSKTVQLYEIQKTFHIQIGYAQIIGLFFPNNLKNMAVANFTWNLKYLFFKVILYMKFDNCYT